MRNIIAAFAFVPLSWISTTVGTWPEQVDVRLSSNQCDNGPVFHAKVAQSERARLQGLSDRPNALLSDEAMIFVWPTAGPRSFWMLDTWIPLSVLFFGNDSRLLSSSEMAVESDPHHPQRLYSDSGNALAVLEAPPGLAHSAAPSGWKELCINSFER